ncbi:MAG: polyprenyl synthetase family protein [Acidobacteriota bacterium]
MSEDPQPAPSPHSSTDSRCGRGKGRASELEDFFRRQREQIDAALDTLLPPPEEPPTLLHRAMRYSIFAGGKRLRPILLLASGRACGAEPEPLLPAACAVELVHTYSLIHDDLPAFDDDDLRRGSPTSHVVFGEAMAILAGDALHTQAFLHLATCAQEAPEPRPWLAAIAELGKAAGSLGMTGGQCQDLQAEGQALDLESMRQLHRAKTGALLAAALRMGALIGGADPPTLETLGRYGDAVGLAFQIVDDILDVEGSLQDLGKRPGADADRGQPTYVTLLGIDGARRETRRLEDEALAALKPMGERGAVLAGLARFIVERSR